MSKVAIVGNASGTGTFTIAAPNSNTDRTLTLPDEAGTVLTSASTTVLPKGGPAFRGAAATNYTVPNATLTQIAFNTEQFDTSSSYSSGVFTVPVSGYYQVNATIAWSGDIAGYWAFSWRLSGSLVYTNAYQISTASATGTNHALSGSDLLYLTEGQALTSYVYQSTGSTKYVTSGGETFASIILVRAA